jgi:seryl-tRNA(Sec) selenium transferase
MNGGDRQHAVLPASWRDHLRAVDRALSKRDLEEAQRAWESAHLAAVESLSWEGLLAAGEACLRIGGSIGARTTAEPAARRAYFAALYRACRENSFDGILRTAEAFANLGDREVVEECVGLVELQADGDQRRRRVAALIGRVGGVPMTARIDGAAASPPTAAA